MAVLDYITIRGYRSIAAIEKLELRPINVVIGANGSGKSNFIGAFSFLRAIRDGQLQNVVRQAGGADRLLHYGSRVTPEMMFEVQFQNTNRYEITLQASQLGELVPKDERAWFNAQRFDTWTSKTLPSEGKEAGISRHVQDKPIPTHVRGWLSTWRIYHFHDTGTSSPLKRTADLNDNTYLRPDGANLPAYLYLLEQKHPVEFEMISKTVQLVAPFFHSFALRPDPLALDKIRLEWRNTNSEDFFDVSSLSDGTLRFVALTTLLLQPAALRPSVILIDEPELGLHPYAIAILASLIKQASVGSQVIVSTQSSLLLDYFEPENILVAELVNGGTELRRLSVEPLEAWLDDYSLGQLWEKNELGGRPGGAVADGTNFGNR